jgi:hypothetical protein
MDSLLGRSDGELIVGLVALPTARPTTTPKVGAKTSPLNGVLAMTSATAIVSPIVRVEKNTRHP